MLEKSTGSAEKIRLQFAEALARAQEREASREEALVVARPRTDDEVLALFSSARRIRERYKGNQITFSKKIFVPLTTLCRDRCRYCTFRRDPGQPGAHTMTPEEVLELAERGARLGCKEALFSLGDRPEGAFPEMRETLARLGHRSTISYLASLCAEVLRHVGLLPHSNPGVMTRRELEALAEVNPSMGLMLENISPRLAEPGMPHEGCPDKAPAARIKTLEEAGRLRVPFTTGVLIGIGETLAERVDSLIAIRELNRRFGHIQEVIIQNFRRKPNIPMRGHPEPGVDDLARTVAVARLILHSVNIQAPPNLADGSLEILAASGLNDWGGISPLTPDHINPERPWPALASLERETAAAGLRLRERLCVYPEFVLRGDWLKPGLSGYVRRLADADGCARKEGWESAQERVAK